MNLSQKKLGEVLAFNKVALETLEKGHTALTEALGIDKVLDIQEKCAMHADTIVRVASDGGALETTTTKAEKTEAKLRSMRDLYVGDQWDNATELMEWSGFFEGAAVVHWALIRGSADALNSEELIALAEEGVNFHYELLELAESHLTTIGQDKAAA